MPSINLDLDYFDHPKTMALVAILGADADVLPIRLWNFCGRFHTATGDVLGSTAGQVIERRIGWRGAAGECVKALVQTGFLDTIPGGYRVHDWLEHSGHLAAYKERAKAAAIARWDKARAEKSARPPNAPSIACSNAPSIAPALHATALLSGSKPSDAAAISLGALWVFHLARRKSRVKADDPDDAQAVFDELQRVHKISESTLAAEIARPERDKTEYLWQLKERLLPKSNGKPKTEFELLRERVEARKKVSDGK